MRSKMFLAMFTIVWMNIAPPQGLNITPGARVLWAGLMRPQIILARKTPVPWREPNTDEMPGTRRSLGLVVCMQGLVDSS